MNKFNVGDLVVRRNDSHAGMKIGDIDEIINIKGKDGSIISLKRYNGVDGSWNHDKDNLRLATEAEREKYYGKQTKEYLIFN